ncbi:Adenylate cyclase-associated CAP, N-terminal [Sesbania bispinosa]|nr:Adenylate cyclase-associated CAP, N-terminal [Sesbania bispinosa]
MIVREHNFNTDKFVHEFRINVKEDLALVDAHVFPPPTKPDLAGFAEFLKPLNEVNTKATALIEGMRSDFFNHLKVAAESLSALAWIAYTGKDCGK